jgi:serine/threonine protein kinase
LKTDKSIPIIRDGLLILNGMTIGIPNTALQKVIGKGASGIVMLGVNHFLERRVAVKIWTKIRPDDRRDKFLQGLNEAKKAVSLEGDWSLLIYDAGEVQHKFYMVMEYYPGVPLRQWMRDLNPPLFWRIRVASEIVYTLHRLHLQRIFHGDPHAENILVDKRQSTLPEAKWGSQLDLHFKLIDFGTSFFAGPAFSMARHWRVLQETVDEILYPLQMGALWNHQRPVSRSPESMSTWFTSYLREVHFMLMWAIENPLSIRGIKKRGSDLPILTASGHHFLANLISSGAIPKHDIEALMNRGTPKNHFVSSGILEYP